MDISNMQGVSVKGNGIIILMPQRVMTKQEALIHAAWLVALADENDEFQGILATVQNT